eukprot:gb/GEZN01004196.1/.p1 GENE.gb/GEZN01004196.1/~~gb/GEZN01004196.1/.p1  ORF type:complete len:501 (+),score=29.49 gb/GEZN01004196.1/:28-1503(+)
MVSPAGPLSQIFIKGLDGRARVLEIGTSEKVSMLRKLVSECTAIPIEEMRLVHNGKQLCEDKDSRQLCQLGIGEGLQIWVLLRLKGGSTCRWWVRKEKAAEPKMWTITFDSEDFLGQFSLRLSESMHVSTVRSLCHEEMTNLLDNERNKLMWKGKNQEAANLRLPSKFQLLLGGKAMDPTKKLQDCPGWNDADHAKGGSESKTVTLLFRWIDPRRHSQLVSRFSPDPDPISFCQDEDDPRITLPNCEHAFTAQTLYTHASSYLDNGMRKTVVVCPMTSKAGTGCNKPIDWAFLRVAADLDAKDVEVIESKANRNYMLKNLEIAHCPMCKAPSYRENPNMTRVKCMVCANFHQRSFEFCFNCVREWKGESRDVCGYGPSCYKGVLDFVTKLLASCATKKVTGISLDVPAYRACPGPKHLGSNEKAMLIGAVEHKSGCKHIKCPYTFCSVEFCFVCLSIKTNGVWPCGSHSTTCDLAPRQDLAAYWKLAEHST